MSQTETLMYKVVFLGNKGVGIHSLVSRLTGNRIVQRDRSIPAGTPQEEFKKRKIVHNKQEVEFAFYETLGQESFRGSLTSSYFRHASGIIYVYDETDAQSFQELTQWQVEANRFSTGSLMQFLIGNKFDLIQGGTPRAVEEERVQDTANSFMTNVMHVSATTGYGCEEAFQYITQQLLQHAKPSKKAVIDDTDDTESTTLSQKAKPAGKKKCMCWWPLKHIRTLFFFWYWSSVGSLHSCFLFISMNQSVFLSLFHYLS